MYGSLMAPEVTKLLIGRMPSTQPATLKDHMRYCVKEADFPAIFPVDGGEVKGLVSRAADANSPRLSSVMTMMMRRRRRTTMMMMMAVMVTVIQDRLSHLRD